MNMRDISRPPTRDEFVILLRAKLEQVVRITEECQELIAQAKALGIDIRYLK